ncbi:MAG TPA: ATP-binding protein [Chitinophagaceae bacterium]|nr:ATP-binding protein [Chitinophagaceae bacterium]
MNPNDVLNRKFRMKRPQNVYFLYWFLLSYILGALLFWFILLNKQNTQLSRYRLDMIDVNDVSHQEKENKIIREKNSNAAEYIGEAITFILLIGAGGVLVFQAINRQFQQAHQQGNFMMAITHELKTPIAITKLNLETLEKRSLNPEQQEKLIRTTIQEANRLNLLCNNMLFANQIEAGVYSVEEETFNLSEFTELWANDFRSRFPSRNIQTEVQPDIFIHGDLLMFQLAVNNLLDNAIKYSGKEDLVLVKVFETGKEIHLQVIDEGPGVAPKDRERVFDKYYRGGSDKIKGTGLGLYLTRKIVQAHHGVIKMKNNSSRGSIFEIILKK